MMAWQVPGDSLARCPVLRPQPELLPASARAKRGRRLEPVGPPRSRLGSRAPDSNDYQEFRLCGSRAIPGAHVPR